MPPHTVEREEGKVEKLSDLGETGSSSSDDDDDD